MSNTKANVGIGIPGWLKAVLVVGGLALLALCGLMAVNSVSTARWQRYANSLRAEGQPLTFAEIDAQRRKIADEVNGALVIEALADTLKSLNENRSTIDRGVLIFGRKPWVGFFFQGIPRYRVDASREFLKQHRHLLKKLDALHEMHTGRYEITLGANAMHTLLPEMPLLRLVGKLKYLESVVALIDGDSKRAARAVRVLAHISATLDEYPVLIGRLVQIAIDAQTVRAIENMLRVGVIDEPTLRSPDEVLTRRIAAGTMKWGFLAERAFFLAMCDDLAAGRLSTADIMSIGGPAAFPFLPDFLLRRNQVRGVEMLTWLVDAADDPQAMIEAAARIDKEVPALPFTQVLVRMLLPSLSRAVVLHLRITSELQCARLAVAAERFRMSQQRLPASLDELVPEFIEAVPRDPFDGQPMRFAATEHGIVIYSINENGVDDGGIVVRQKIKPYVRDVGFRLFRPEHRGIFLTEEPAPTDD